MFRPNKKLKSGGFKKQWKSCLGEESHWDLVGFVTHGEEAIAWIFFGHGVQVSRLK